MPTYLLNWNPRRWPWTNLAQEARQTIKGNPLPGDWSCGKTRKIRKGDRIFLLRQGIEPRGIMAAGWVTGREPVLKPHWDAERADRGERTLFVNAEFDLILDPGAGHDPLPHSRLQTGALARVHWNIQSGGMEIEPSAAEELERVWQSHLQDLGLGTASPQGWQGTSADDDEDEFPEGREKYRLHRERERDSRLVQRKKDQVMRNEGRLACAVCKFDFAERYGAVGEGYIECHHTLPLSELEGERRTRLVDLALVCSNCHRMLHRKRPWLGMDELAAILRAVK